MWAPSLAMQALPSRRLSLLLLPMLGATRAQQRAAKTTADLALDATRDLTSDMVEHFWDKQQFVMRNAFQTWYYPHERRLAGAAIATALLDSPAVCKFEGDGKREHESYPCASSFPDVIGVVVGGLGSVPPQTGLPPLNDGDVGFVLARYFIPFHDPAVDWYVFAFADDPAATFVDPVFGQRTTAYWPKLRGSWPHFGAGPSDSWPDERPPLFVPGTGFVPQG